MKELPKFTEGPWSLVIDDDGCEWTGWPLCITQVTDEEKTIVNGAGFLPYPFSTETISQRETVANAHLIAASPLLYMALWAQEVASEMQKDKAMPNPDDPRYEPFIGPWDGYQAPEIRFHDFMVKRQQLRQEALKAARGE